MKTNKIFYSILVLLVLCCGCLHAQDSLTLVRGTVKAKNLKIRKGMGKLEVSMDLSLDSLKLASNRFIKLTPVVTDDKNSRTLTPIIISGRKQNIMYQRVRGKEYEKEGTTPVVIRRKNKTVQTVSYRDTVSYAQWMKEAELKMAEDLCGCGGDPLSQETTPLEAWNFEVPVYNEQPAMSFVIPKAEVVKVRMETGSAFLDFPVNQTVIYPDYRRNDSELAKIRATIDLVKNDPNTRITHIGIHGYASPEGSYQNNVRLAQGRAEALKEYVRKQYHFADSLFDVRSTPEDWEGLRRYVAQSDMEYKEELLAIIDGPLEPDPKNWKLQTVDSKKPYEFLLKNVYPALRHSDYTVQYTVRKFSVEEAKQQLKTRPQLLSLEEMFAIAQTYEPGSPEFKEVFDIAVRVFPDDETANLNAACIYLEEGNLERAEKYLLKAGNSPEAVHAQGVLAMLKGDYSRAIPLLEQAGQAGVIQAQENLKQIEMKQKNIQQRKELEEY